MAEDPIAILENRVKNLEMKILGTSETLPNNPDSSIIDNFLESHKVITSAISGREQITAVIKRLDQLETALDPMYEDSVVDNAAKLVFILSMEQELEEITHNLVRVSELSSALESDQLRSLPQLMKQLNTLTNTMLEHKEKYDLVDEKVDDLITKYTEITNGVVAVFAALNNTVSELELKSQPKKVIE